MPPLTLADPSSGEDLAAQNPATGLPTDIWQNASAAYDSSRLNDRYIGEGTALSDEYARFNDQVFQTSGQRLPNPIEGESPGATPGTLLGPDPHVQIPRDVLVQQYMDYAHSLGADPPSYDQVVAAAHKRMYDVEMQRQDIAARGGAGSGLAQFAGSTAAVISDPPVLASMMFGGGETAGVLASIGREAATAGVVETAVQPQIQSQRIAAGLPGGFKQGAANVVMAAAGTAGLGALFRGTKAAYGALRQRVSNFTPANAAEADAARYTERYSDLQSQNPLQESPQGIAEHVDRLSASQSRLYDLDGDGPETRIPDEPVTSLQQVPDLNEPAIDSVEPLEGHAAAEGDAQAPDSEAASETPAEPQDGVSEPPTASEPEPIATRDIGPDSAALASGREVPVRYAVVEADDLTASQTQAGTANPSYPAELQPRDRTRAVSQNQVAQIAQNLNPRLLDKSPEATSGAPIIAPSGVVESGNGRALAIQRAYSEQTPQAESYRAHLQSQGYPVDGMKAPVLVRVRDADMTPEERQSFVREANHTGTLGYSATERAMNDANALPDSALDLYHGGDVERAQNRDFARAFINTLPQSEHAGMVDASGALSQDAVRRIRGALLAKAYGDPDLVSGVVESTDSNIKAIGGAMTDAAADWSKMRDRAARGQIPADLDRTGNLLDAVRLVQRARSEGRNVAEFVGQGDIFSGGLDPDTEAWLRLMFRNTKDWTQPTGRDRFADAIRYYADEASKAEADGNLFGMEPVQSSDILSLAKEKQNARSVGATNLSFNYGQGVRPGRDAGAELGSQEAAAIRGESAAGSSAGRSSTTAGLSPDLLAEASAYGQRLARDARAGVATANASKATRETAQALRTGGLPDEALNLARSPAPRPPADDPSLVQFIINKGGVRDADQALAGQDITPRGRPGLIRRAGTSLADMAQQAAEAGFLPADADVQSLVRAIKDDLSGHKVYARNGSFGNASARQAFETTAANRAAIREAFEQLGLDPESMANDDLRDAVTTMADDSPDVPAVRNNFTQEAIDNAGRADAELRRQSAAEQSIADAAERSLRADFADRMDYPVYLEGANGEIHTATAQEIFDSLSDDEKLATEFKNCMEG